MEILSLTVATDYNSSLNLIKDFERSIRPFDITTVVLSGNLANMSVNMQINTYFQPAVSLQISEKEVK
jgi:hypothetical protein